MRTTMALAALLGFEWFVDIMDRSDWFRSATQKDLANSMTEVGFVDNVKWISFNLIRHCYSGDAIINAFPQRSIDRSIDRSSIDSVIVFHDGSFSAREIHIIYSLFTNGNKDIITSIHTCSSGTVFIQPRCVNTYTKIDTRALVFVVAIVSKSITELSLVSNYYRDTYGTNLYIYSLLSNFLLDSS